MKGKATNKLAVLAGKESTQRSHFPTFNLKSVIDSVILLITSDEIVLTEYSVDEH